LSIVPVRDKKRFITLPSGKIKDVNVVSNNVLMPRSNKDYSNFSKTIEELKREIKEKNKEILELKSELSGNTLKQRLEHANFKLKNYELFCFVASKNIQITQCIHKREKKDCLRLCRSFKDKLGI